MATESISNTLGAGSGIDVTALVTSLVDAQFAAKTEQLTTKSEQLTNQISAIGTLKNSITGFAAALASLTKGGTLATQPTSSNSSILNVTGLSGAKLAGLSATLEVRQLAAAQAATTGIVTDPSVIGTGTLTLTLGTATVANGAMTGFVAGTRTPVDIIIDTSNSSLAGIARAINSSGAGVTATVLTDADGARLSIRGATGAEQAFTLTATETPDAPGLAALNIGVGASGTTIGTTARDAIVAVDGVALKRPSNNISDLITGVKIDLLSAAVGTTVTLGTTAPTSALSQAVNDFVSTFNELNTIVKEQTNVVDGALKNDTAATSMSRALAQMTVTKLTTGRPTDEPSTLAEIGVATNRDGTLSVNADRLAAAIAKWPGAVEAMFADGTGESGRGLGAALTTISIAATNLTTGLGASANRYNKLKADIADDQTDIVEATEKLRTRLTQQYSSMDSRVAAYKSTLAFLEQQVETWNSN